MSLIGNITIGLSAQIDPLLKGLKKGAGAVGDFGNSLTGSIGKVTAWGSAIGAVVGVGGLSVMVAQAFDSIDALGAMADKVGESTAKLSALHFAASQSDVEIETLNAALTKMTANLGQASLGSTSAANAFGQLGLSVDALTQQSPTEQFKAIADRIAAIQSPAEQAALAMQIFGKAGADLLPLLTLGSEGIAALEAEGMNLGAVLNDVDVAKVKEANDALDKVKTSFMAVANTLAIQLAPFVTYLSERFLEAGGNGQNMAQMVITGFEWVLTAVAHAVDYFKYFEAAFYGIKAVCGVVMTAVAGIVTLTLKGIAESINWVMESLGFARVEALDGMASFSAEMTRSLGQQTSDALQDMDKALNAPSKAEGVKKLFDDIRNGANAAAEQTDKMKQPFEAVSDSVVKLTEDISKLTDDWKLQAETFGMSSRQAEIYKLAIAGASEAQLKQLEALDKTLTAQEKQQKLMDEGKAVTEANLNPMEKYKKEIEKLDELLMAGAISNDTFNKAVLKAQEDMLGEKAAGQGTQEAKFSGAISANSVDAFSILNSARNTTNNPQDKIFKQGEKQTEILAQIAANTKTINSPENAYEFN